MTDNQPVVNTSPSDLNCPFCKAPLVGGPQWYDCPECRTFSRNIGRITGCVVCGEDATYTVPAGDCKFFTVCAEHLYPEYRIRMHLAWQDLSLTIVEEVHKVMKWLKRE